MVVRQGSLSRRIYEEQLDKAETEKSYPPLCSKSNSGVNLRKYKFELDIVGLRWKGRDRLKIELWNR